MCLPKSGSVRLQPFTHPALLQSQRVTDAIQQQDIMLYFPYHSFNTIIDLLREAAIEPDVISIKITALTALAEDSKIANALINAARNGKDVTVVLELRARFNEEANLEWKIILEDEGVKVLVGSRKHEGSCEGMRDKKTQRQACKRVWFCKHRQPERKNINRVS